MEYQLNKFKAFWTILFKQNIEKVSCSDSFNDFCMFLKSFKFLTVSNNVHTLYLSKV